PLPTRRSSDLCPQPAKARAKNLFPVCRLRRVRLIPPQRSDFRVLPFLDLFLGRPLFQRFPVVHPRCDGRFLFSISFCRHHRSPSSSDFALLQPIEHPTSS